MEDTIAAVATTVGESSINVIRISGKDSISVANRIFSKDISNVSSHTVHYGFIMENETDGYIKIMVKSIRNFDGIMDTHYNETKINYKKGLFQEWVATGYHANYYDWCKNRNAVISHGKRMLGVK